MRSGREKSGNVQWQLAVFLVCLGVIHPATRQAASPAGGRHASVNPPPLLWPAARGSQVRYAVRLSQDPGFPERRTVTAEGLPWAMFNPHRKLATGTWYWQYGTTSRPGKKPEWSEVYRFEIDDAARVFVTPSAAEMLSACPKGHPRILVAADELRLLQERWKGTAELARIAKYADRYIGRELPDESRGRPTETSDVEYEARNYAKWASKAYAGNLVGSISYLVPTYLLTGDARYGREAARRALHVARLDPDGVTSRSVSDFADGSCMRAMALAYDACFDLLTEKERSLLREAMTERADRFYNRQVNNLETRVFSAHIWQHILIEFAEVAFATLGEVPDAETWATYVYELWIARFPLLGGDDGGWANGAGYFGTNIYTLLDVPTLFGRLTGVDFFDHPWYRNVIYYQLYVWPPGSASDGFGDGCERESKPSGSRAVFLETLGRKFADPYALWYAKEILGELGRPGDSPMAMLRQFRWETPEKLPRPKSPRDLPQARAFRDIGVVSMHTDLADASKDLMIGFRSSPYGSYNHMHACQNSFNLLYGGERLFSNSGYYIAYGDAHFKGWYTHTRGHNCVLIDDKGQLRGAEGFGLVARYLDGRQVSYCLGDASEAYGDAGLTKFRRHLALLRPSTVVIYDELEADHPARWSWLLHSKAKITPDAGRQRLVAEVKTARGQVNLLASAPLEVSVDDRFDPPAVNWRKRKQGGKIIKYPNQWHATAVPAQRSAKARFLAVIQVRPTGDASGFEDPVVEDDGWVRVGDWRIQAELNTARDASLLVERADRQAVLAVDKTSVTCGRTHYDLPPGTSLLVEQTGEIVRRCRDELPQAAR